MPGPLHETFLYSVVRAIQCKLRLFADTDGPSGDFARKVRHFGSYRLDLLGRYKNPRAIIKRTPDAVFVHRDARWPGVIIEVSYSQQKKNLPRLADNYIIGTRGSVRVVIGLDIDYNTKKGTLSMWRPSYVRNEQGRLIFRAAQTIDNQVSSLRFLCTH
jgi:hypothetical protein